MYHCNAKTRMSMTEYDFEWTIENFSQVMEGNEVIMDCKFNNEFWYFEIKPEFNSTEIKVKLYRSVSNSNLVLKSKTTITDSGGNFFYENLENMKYKKSDKKNVNECIAFVRHETYDLTANISNNTIIIDVNLKLFTTCTKVVENVPQEKQFLKEVEKHFSDDIVRLLDNNTLTDIILLVDGQEIHAHKAILCARSPVFAKMFQCEMAESKSNVIYVEDVSLLAMEELTKFLYSKVKFDYDFSTALDVYYAADKYEVVQLREVCGKIMLDELNSENAGLVLKLADRHNDAKLKEKVMRFVKDNFESCAKSSWWDKFKNKENKELFYDLMSFISK